MQVVRTKIMTQGKYSYLPTLAESLSLYFLHILEQLFSTHPAYFPTLQTEEAGYTKTLTANYKATWRYVPDVCNLRKTHGESINIPQN
jgi:hypothetical protein